MIYIEQTAGKFLGFT